MRRVCAAHRLPVACERRVSSDGRTRLSVKQRRQQLLDLGRQLFCERPFAELSVDDIAEAAGISKGLLYHYFPSKRELFIACVNEAAQEILQASDPPADTPASERLAVSIDGFIDHVEANLLSFGHLLQGTANGDPGVDAVLMKMRRAFIDRTVRHLGVNSPSSTTRMCLLGYVGFASYTCMTWARGARVSRKALRYMLLSSLQNAVKCAAVLAEGDEQACLLAGADLLVIQAV